MGICFCLTDQQMGKSGSSSSTDIKVVFGFVSHRCCWMSMSDGHNPSFGMGGLGKKVQKFLISSSFQYFYYFQICVVTLFKIQFKFENKILFLRQRIVFLIQKICYHHHQYQHHHHTHRYPPAQVYHKSIFEYFPNIYTSLRAQHHVPLIYQKYVLLYP